MRYILALLLVSTTLTSPCMAEEKTSYVGRLYPPLPDECIHQESGVLDKGITVAYTRARCNGKEVLWLERFVKRQGKLASWQVVDAIVFPQLARGKVLDVQFCSLRDDKQFAVAAIGSWVQTKAGSFYAAPIMAAWKLDHANLKIEPLSPQEVVCEYEEID